jgi:hypothetical protein
MFSTLAASALDLRRRVYASLPWGFRLANLLMRVSSNTDAFGRVAYGLFLMAGVTELPSIDGKPPEVFEPDTFRDIDKFLPREYGKAYGEKVYRALLKSFRNPSFVEDIMSMGLIKVMDAISNKGGTLLSHLRWKTKAEAENFLLRMMINMGIDVTRRENKSLSIVDEEGEDRIIEDPQAFKQLEDLLPEKEMAQIKHELEKIDERLAPDIDLYFDLLLEGYKDSVIVRDKMLPFLQERQMTQSNWSRTYKERIKEVLRKHLRPN